MSLPSVLPGRVSFETKKPGSHPRHWKMAASATKAAVMKKACHAYFQCVLEKNTKARKLEAMSERNVMEPPARTGFPQKLKLGSGEKREDRKKARAKPPKHSKPTLARETFCLMLSSMRKRLSPKNRNARSRRTEEKKARNAMDFPHSGGENQGGRLTNGSMRT